MTLPAFDYPVIGLLTPRLPPERGEVGWREFPSEARLVNSWPTDVSARKGMILVDASDRCWKVASVRVLGPVGGRLERVWRALRRSREVRLDYDLIEQPPMPFARVKGALHVSLSAHRGSLVIGDRDYARDERARINSAQTLRDLVVTEEQRLLALAPTAPPNLFERALGEGRLSRRGYALCLGVVTGLSWVAISLAVLWPGWYVVAFIILLMGATSASARRLRDLGRSPWSLLWAVLWTLALAVLHDLVADVVFRFWLGWVWVTPLVAALAALLLWPGSSRTNRYGPAPGPWRGGASTPPDR